MIWQLTGWSCVNWHNLLGQDVRLPGGDVFNVGPMESGKTTWIDAVQLVLTAGVGMEWNSAADPTMSRTRLKEEGRSLKGIVFREEKGKKLMPNAPTRSYFAIELTRGKESVVLGICAYGTSYNAGIEEWWILAKGRKLDDLQFIERNEDHEIALSVAAFRETNGQHTIMRKAAYRVQVAKLVFDDLVEISPDLEGDEARRRMDEMQRFLNLAKSYGRLRSADTGALFRDALPAPDEGRLQDAKRRFEEIDTLRQSIRRGEDRLAKLEDLRKTTTRVRELRIVKAGSAYGQVHLRYTAAESDVRTSKSKVTDLQRDLEKAERVQAELDAQVKEQKDFVEALHSHEDTRLVREADQKRSGVEDYTKEAQVAKTSLERIKEWRKAAKTSLNEAEAAVDKARRALYAKAAETVQWMPEGLQPAYRALAEGFRQDQTPRIEEGIGECDRLIAQFREACISEERKLHGQLAGFQAQLDTAQAQRRELLRYEHPSPVDGLNDAIADIERDAIVVHRSIEHRHARDAALLDQFLPAEVLGAVIPLDGANTERIRRHVHRRHPHIKVVDRDELREGPISGLLSCLDVEESDPLAIAYLKATYGDVEILDSIDKRDDRERVVWRDGRVYDGVAWTLENPDQEARFIGLAALKALRNKLLRDLDANIEDAIQKTTAVKDCLRESERRRQGVEKRAHTVRQAWTAARLDHLQGEVRLMESKYKDLLERHTKAEAEEESARKSLRRAQSTLAKLEEVIRKRGAEGIMEKLSKARRNLEEVSDKCNMQGKSAAVLGDRLNHGTKRLKDREEKLAGLIEELSEARRTVLEAGASPEGDFQEWAKRNGYIVAADQTTSLEMRRNRAMGDEGKATAQAIHLCGELRQDDLALNYDDESNEVREANTAVILQDMIQGLEEETKSENKRRIQRIEDIQQEQIVGPIAEQMKRNLLQKDQLISGVNKALRVTSFNGSTFRLHSSYHTQADDGFLRLVEAYDGSDNPTLVQAIRQRLERGDSGDVLVAFDYRKWFKFTLRRVHGDEETNVEDHRAKASGGGQAAPHYILMFILLKVFYDSHGARLQSAFLDEAFRGVDSGHALQLIQLAKDLGLTLFTADTEKAGHPDLQESASVQQFARSKNGDAFVLTFTQEFPEAPA